ncbi:hypothetical protein [Streptomyces sp. NPDC127084]|uniref:hypothetical protein n=1 Tax=Streptomyces sp. NPDC127084 TaxID=3347133 RepID=UPI00364957D6
MHSHLSFENPPALPHEVVVETMERALRDRSTEGEAAGVLVGTALNDDDAEFVERLVTVTTLVPHASAARGKRLDAFVVRAWSRF